MKKKIVRIFLQLSYWKYCTDDWMKANKTKQKIDETNIEDKPKKPNNNNSTKRTKERDSNKKWQMKMKKKGKTRIA